MTWYENGLPRSVGWFAHGQPDGLHQTWSESGKRTSEGRYEGGFPTGLWKYWRDDGSEDLELTGVYAAGSKR